MIRKVDDFKALNKDFFFTYPFSMYRNHNYVLPKKRSNLMLYMINRHMECDENYTFVSTHSDSEMINAFVIISLLPHESACFRMRMAELKYFMIANSENAADVGAKMLETVFSFCKKNKIMHLVCKVDVSDMSVIHALQREEFLYMDTAVSYVFNPRKKNNMIYKDLALFRPMVDDDLQHIIALVDETTFQTRFFKDTRFTISDVKLFYRRWIYNCCSPRNVRVNCVVAFRDEKLVGFCLSSPNEDISLFLGEPVFGSSLCAIAKDAKGIFPGLCQYCIQHVGFPISFIDTQIQNKEVVKSVSALGMDSVYFYHSFHLNL
jgi:hypothetical protein